MSSGIFRLEIILARTWTSETVDREAGDQESAAPKGAARQEGSHEASDNFM